MSLPSPPTHSQNPQGVASAVDSGNQQGRRWLTGAKRPPQQCGRERKLRAGGGGAHGPWAPCSVSLNCSCPKAMGGQRERAGGGSCGEKRTHL